MVNSLCVKIELLVGTGRLAISTVVRLQEWDELSSAYADLLPVIFAQTEEAYGIVHFLAFTACMISVARLMLAWCK